MHTQRIIVACMFSIVFLSCRKEVVRDEQIVLPSVEVQQVKYDESKILRVPGNYQGWNIASSPTIVSVNGNGVYEGYVNFTLANTEFWLVKGTHWDNVVTYNETGNQTFGHNGTFFTPPSGAGVYKIEADMNTFKWAATKINSFGITGSAINAGTGDDLEMEFKPASLSWYITREFKAGEFVFRANNANGIVLGHKPESPAGLLEYNGDKIALTKAGKYTIELCLKSAGGYVYSIRRVI